MTARPIGILPFKIWIDMRHADVKEAIRRFQAANIKHPEKWERELQWLEEQKKHESV